MFIRVLGAAVAVLLLSGCITFNPSPGVARVSIPEVEDCRVPRVGVTLAELKERFRDCEESARKVNRAIRGQSGEK